jgi:serine/threonine protein kinase
MAEAAGSSHPNALPTGRELLEYRIGSVLGEDGFGISYRAQDTILHREVAIKEYFPSDLALRAPDGNVAPVGAGTESNFRKGLTQFLVEARTLARFVHPNIGRVDRYFEANGTAYMLREYEKGESLSQKFARGPRPDEAALKAILAPLLDGLQAVHRAGVLHRDIKPGNVFVRDEGSPVLFDFGAARLASRDAIQDIIPILTPGYAPIEQYIRSSGQGPWSDIYSLAAVLFWAVTGEAPSDVLSRLRMDNVGRMLNAARPRYSAAFLAAIQWGLAIEEGKRPQSVQQWRGALLRGEQVHEGVASVPAPLADGTRKYVWMSLGVLIFFLFVAGADILQQRAEQQRATRLAAPSGDPSAGRAAGRAGASQRPAPSQAAGLTRDEFTQNLPHLAPRFLEIDIDKSGYVSTEELQSYLRRQNP